MSSDQNQRLGQLLVQTGQLNDEQLRQALAQLEKEQQGSLLTVLVDMGILPFMTVSKFVQKALGMKTFVIGERRIPADVVALVNVEKIMRDWIFPIGIKESADGKFLVLGMVDPLAVGMVMQLEAELQYRIYPLLISKPDYLNALQNHSIQKADATAVLDTNNPVKAKTATLPLPPLPKIPGASQPRWGNKDGMGLDDEKSVSLAKPESADPVVIIRPGGYEEEIAFEAKRQETAVKGTSSHEMTGFGNVSTAGLLPQSAYYGEFQKRYREEVLAKLDIEPKESGLLRQETYSRELLAKELYEMTTKVLSNAYDSLSAELKVEALLNALIDKGLLTKREVFIQGATSFVFSTKTDNMKS